VVAAPSSGSGGLVADDIVLLLASSCNSFLVSSPSFHLLFSFLALLCFLDAAATAWGKGALGSRVCDKVEVAFIGSSRGSIEARTPRITWAGLRACARTHDGHRVVPR
jgi:hypothetical protein